MCLLYRAKSICSRFDLYMQELKRLRNIFHENGYPDWFINKTINKFDQLNEYVPENYEKDFLFFIGILFFGSFLNVFCFASFLNVFCSFVKTKFHVDINVYYKCFKTSSYF